MAVRHYQSGGFQSLSYCKHTRQLIIILKHMKEHLPLSFANLCVGALLQNYTDISSTSFSFLQERAGCKMQMIQDGQFANAPEKPLRMTGLPESCKVLTTLVLYVDHYVQKSEITWVDFFW